MLRLSVAVTGVCIRKGLLLGIPVLPETAVAQKVKAGSSVSRQIQDARFTRSLGVIHLKGKFLYRPAKEFLKILDKAGD